MATERPMKRRRISITRLIIVVSVPLGLFLTEVIGGLLYNSSWFLGFAYPAITTEDMVRLPQPVSYFLTFMTAALFLVAACIVLALLGLILYGFFVWLFPEK